MKKFGFLMIFLCSLMLAVSGTAWAVTIDGTIDPGEWSNSWMVFDTGPRVAGDSGWKNTGVKAWTAWDSTYLYFAFQGYPGTATENINGPLSDGFLDLWGPGGHLGFFGDDMSGAYPGWGTAWPGGMDSLRGGSGHGLTVPVVDPSVAFDWGLYDWEIAIPYAGIGFDPTSETLEWRVSITDCDTAGGMDIAQLTSGDYITPPNYSPDNYIFTTYGAENLVTVPDPSTLLLLGAGFLGLAAFGRKKLRKLD